jgi:spermidine/putrescine transport system substrate-binding protein
MSHPTDLSPARATLRRVVAAALALSLVAACGIAGQSPSPGQPADTPAPTPGTGPTGSPNGTALPTGGAPTADATVEPTGEPVPTPQPTPAGEVVFANWPEYIDIDEETGVYPTLELFTERTGIAVRYQEDIADNAEFFGRIQPDLAAGNPTGYDLVVLSDWMIQRMIELDYLEPIDRSMLPNFEQNLNDVFGDPWYDPGHQYSVPWQGGITGIAYNPTLTGREITSFDDLLDPAFAGSVGLFSEMYDTLGLALLSMGVEPAVATLEQVEAARDKLLEAAERGQFRGFYGNEYYTELADGNLAISIAWSGDISQMNLYDNEHVVFVVPADGGMFWVDNMAIPRAAQHPVDAHVLMDHFYDLDVAAMLTEYIGYYSPVQGIRERVLEDAQAAREEGDEEWAGQLEEIARTAFPDETVLDELHPYPRLPLDVFRQWQDLFDPLIHG